MATQACNPSVEVAVASGILPSRRLDGLSKPRRGSVSKMSWMAQVEVCSFRLDSLSLVSRVHGKRENPPPRGIPWTLHLGRGTQTPHTQITNYFEKWSVCLGNNTHVCTHTNMHIHMQGKYMETEMRRGGRWGAGRL